MLHFDTAVSIELLLELASHAPDTLRWAIRYSKLFERTASSLWLALRAALVGGEWQVFFGVCDRLLDQLKPFDELITNAEKQLGHLSLLELFSYLSVLAYQAFSEDASDDRSGQQWKVYNRIILRKLQACPEEDFRLNESRLGQSLKRHLSPIIFPESSTVDAARCRENLEWLAVLIAATQERIDYEGSIDWFCFDPECRYQLKPGESVIYNQSEAGTERWQRTGRKSDLLWLYWMNRAVQAFVDSGLAEQIIGSPENHELNQLAYIKAMRSELQLQQIYGLGDRLSLSDGVQVQLHQVLLASELTSVFFQSQFIQPFQDYLRESGVLADALGRLALDGMLSGENRFPMTWSEEDEKIRRIKGWTVSEEHPQGSADSAKALLKFWTSDLKALSQQMKQQPGMPAPRLYEQPFYKVGRYSFQFPWVGAQQNNLTAAINNLRRVNARRADVQAETQRVELALAESLRQRGFTVEVGYRPPVTEEDNAGEVDLICQQDGVLLLMEVKSGYIRSTTHEVWLHRTNTLRKAAWQLRRKRIAVAKALVADQDLRFRLGYHGQHPEADLRAWIVDTSIELDGQSVDGFRVVSREALEVILRDEKQLLRPMGQLDEGGQHSLFPDGFTAGRFIAVVESDELWRGIC
ncbi:TPA: NERD domain-containing protein [Pseudomonas aeruginosa]|uniref:NERD domain-containing protein n=1 Tax=Pseudomonas aeruginosa TaxID=287 RepID=UPI0015969C57|nr:NERD domain-containing protein [Pseudomonas aeruginosa]MCV6455346.1 YraN family protein [Pseudomonas aeruginosa]MDP5511768.1 NERD domain-containing protein [Pseudomonas aeruginosa]HBO2595359.1 NERD domain-containing protein [Pseudomonas aeruginosa]HCE8380603.1 NERD domain-containing protein [Pseudomonas aeruginosa]HCF6697471.1 NERD domain-containing protein [Pseudomonas aeruginosa]